MLNNPLNATDPSGYFFQMLVIWAVNYVGAIEGGGTAMANFAGGMAKGQIFNCVTGAGKCLLAGDGNAATGQSAADSPNAPQPVDNKQGTASTDVHGSRSRRYSDGLDGKGPHKVTTITQGKSLGDLQAGLQFVNSVLGNDEYDANSVVKAGNDFLEAIRKHPHAGELTSSELEFLQMHHAVINIKGLWLGACITP